MRSRCNVAEAVAAPPPRRGRWIVPVAVAAVIGAGWALVAFDGGGTSSNDATRPGVPVAQDRPAPEVVAPLLGRAGTLSLGRERGSVVVVTFWSSWCRACRTEAPALDALWRGYAGPGVRFVGVDYEDRRSAALAAARAFGMRYPSVIDPNGSIGDAFGIYGLPTTYVIDAGQRIRYMVVGRVRPASFRPALDRTIDSATVGGAAP
jgi:thiol-disulfide isomerase/thioredoxin